MNAQGTTVRPRSPRRNDVVYALTGVVFWPLWACFLSPTRTWNARNLLVATILAVPYVAVYFLPQAVSIYVIVGVVGALITGYLAMKNSGVAPPLPDAQKRLNVLEDRLKECDDLILKIDSDMRLDLLPPTSPIVENFHGGLSVRERASDLIKSNPSNADEVDRLLRSAHSAFAQTLRSLDR